MTALARIPLPFRLWIGVFGAPLAWATQHVTGYALTEATCNTAGQHVWSVPFDGWAIAVAATAALIAVVGLVFAISVFLETREASGEHDPPPDSRIHFLAVVGMAITPLFLCIILMSGLGSVLMDGCRQG